MSTKKPINVVKKKREGGAEPAFDMEQQFIMRLPPGPAMALRQEVKAGSMHLKDRLSIELQPDLRKGAIRYGNDYFSAKMMDLPCIIECHKTVDMKTFYKTADVSQMLITTTEEDAVQDEVESPKKKDKDKRYIWNHGLTPPLKNVRKRRFRKTLKKKYMEQPDIEKEVKRLFRTDSEAISVSWELITEDEKPEEGGEGGEEAGTSMSGGFTRTDTGASLDIDIFGVLSSSEDEEEKDVNIVDSEEEEMKQANFLAMGTPQSQGAGPDPSTDAAAAFIAGLEGNMSRSQSGSDGFMGMKMETDTDPGLEGNMSRSQRVSDGFMGMKMETDTDPDGSQLPYTSMDEPLDDITSSLKEEMKKEDNDLDLMDT